MWRCHYWGKSGWLEHKPVIPWWSVWSLRCLLSDERVGSITAGRLWTKGWVMSPEEGKEQDGERFHHDTQNSVQIKTYELSISKIFHLLISKGRWLLVSETTWQNLGWGGLRNGRGPACAGNVSFWAPAYPRIQYFLFHYKRTPMWFLWQVVRGWTLLVTFHFTYIWYVETESELNWGLKIGHFWQLTSAHHFD